jgi:hypothetical protein
MKKRILIAAILLSFILAGPASAVKRVPKSDNQANEEKQRESQASQAPDKAALRPEHNQDGNRDAARTKQPEQPSGERHRDNFIDKDGDGINDNLKKPPETVKRKKEERSDRSEKSDKTEKDRRSR